MIKKYIIKKELNLEFRNNTSLFLITPTMCVIIIVFPILSENRFRVEYDVFVIVQLLFLIFFTTLFSIRNPLEEQALIKELNFGAIKKIDYFYSKTISELGIFYPLLISWQFLLVAYLYYFLCFILLLECNYGKFIFSNVYKFQ